jgi:hypothetical protein
VSGQRKEQQRHAPSERLAAFEGGRADEGIGRPGMTETG